MISRLRRRTAGRRTGNALVPVFGNDKKALPQIYLQDAKAVAPVFLPESGDSGVGARFKWLVSTCLAGVVGIGVIGVSVYASMNVDDGSGVVSSIKRASMAAMQPMQRTRAAAEDQIVYGEKSDRIQETERGLATTQIIQDSVEQKVGGQGYIKIRRYGRLVARLATAQPDDIDQIPPFNPFKLYSNPTPVGDSAETGAEEVANREVTVKVVELDGGLVPDEDSLELGATQVARLIADAGETYTEAPYAMRPAIMPEGARNFGLGPRSGLVRKASFTPQGQLVPPPARGAPANTTIVEKTWIEPDDDVLQNTELRTVTVKSGDTLMSILTDAGAEAWQAKSISEAMAPVFLARSLQKGQEVRLTLAPAPSDTGQMEPVKVSLFAGGRHEVTVARDGSGGYIVSDDPVKLARNSHKSIPKRATLYTSFYDAAMNRDLPPDMISKVLRIHSYDVDFKRPVHAGDSFEVFFDLEKNDGGRETEPGELLYTSMTVRGETRRFYRFRTPDGGVDYYDDDGNSAKKFLMRQPVKGSRLTSGFGMRRHPVLGRSRMHTGVDWAAPRNTPVLAAGSGIVEQVGRKGGYGNYVLLRHANGFKTAYGHMAGFAKGMRPGIHVTQGQIIGYVGSTGMSTGPHCHFEVLVNNRFVNPMTIHVPRGRQLTGKLLARFQKERSRIETLMHRRAVTTQVAAATPAAR